MVHFTLNAELKGLETEADLNVTVKRTNEKDDLRVKSARFPRNKFTYVPLSSVQRHWSKAATVIGTFSVQSLWAGKWKSCSFYPSLKPPLISDRLNLELCEGFYKRMALLKDGCNLVFHAIYLSII